MNFNRIQSGLFILGTVILASCGNSDQTAQQAAPPPTPVTTYTVSEENVTIVDTYPGQVVPLNEVELRAQVGGYITAIYVKDGQKVTKGQKLYEIDRTKYVAAQRSAQADVQMAKSNLAKAKKDAERYTKLSEQEAIAKQRVDYALTDLANAESQVAAAQANLANVNADLQRSVIVSPLNGTIGISQVKLGAFVSPGTTLINTVSTTNPIAVDISVNQRDIARFAKLQQNPSAMKDSVFTLEMQDKSVYPMAGRIVTIDRAVDPNAGTIKVRISYPNANNSLLAGMNCNVKVLNRSEGKQLTIPYKAVTEQLGSYSVYVVGDSSKAEPRIVKLGSVMGDKVVIKDGLKKDEVIVSEGQQNVRPGAVVAAGPAKADPANSGPAK
ncbi:membrane fusion protein (multidrug efflux system) [Pedobacter sp. CAN_A7]|uniref:efflux RND transporter periplasmic adaptor subunit n=1 Tax=Pedobacter sp. CAN_A7 TaxID=2787722 RepID=UPI0018C9FCCD